MSDCEHRVFGGWSCVRTGEHTVHVGHLGEDR